jgi:hypothetical protein
MARDPLPFPPKSARRIRAKIDLLNAKYGPGWDRGCVGTEHRRALMLLQGYWTALDHLTGKV